MTGYGQALYDDGHYAISVEIKTLNSKFLDANIRIPKIFNDRELTIRNMISEQLERGKVSLTLEFSNKQEAMSKVNLNEKLFREYYEKLKHLSESVGSNSEDLFRLAVQFPEVMETIENGGDREEEWKVIEKVIAEAIDQCNQFREMEGKVLAGQLENYIASIRKYLDEIKAIDPQRIEKIKLRLKNNLHEFAVAEELDMNRLEQEIIYYIEKLDIQEEIVRLSSHLNYFLEILNGPKSMGKKLGFIGQEIGREINTLGSKANDAAMQKLVINMKEELEKIKEQVLNIL